jgi:hypothetical protein
MKKNLLILFIPIVLAAGTFLVVSGSASGWNPPTRTPVADNTDAPLNVGSLGQTKIGGLIVNSGGNAAGNGLVVLGAVGIHKNNPSNLFEVYVSSTNATSAFIVMASGNIGIGTNNPFSRLSVRGGIQIGDDLASCTSTKSGTLRWHSSLQICNGSNWVNL